MKKIFIALAVLVAGLVALASFTGITPGYISSASAVGTGIGSKLLCSSYYVSGFSKQQSFDDLVQYSAILEQLTVSYDETAKTVTTDLFGLNKTTASYIPGIGCAVNYPENNARQALVTRSPVLSQALWPAGDQVTTAHPDVQALIESQIQRDNAAGLNTRALVVAHKGQLIAEAYDQGTDSSTPLLGWSMAKSLTAIMLGNLEYRGMLDLNARPGFAQWANDERAQITVTDLLTMTDGLEFSEQYNPGDDATAMLFTVPNMSDYVLAKPLGNTPGSHFNYSSGTANLLSRLYFKTIGGTAQSNYDDFQQHIAAAFNFQNAIFETDASGAFVSSSYFYASGRDWARIGQLMLDGGVINGERLVRGDWVSRATAQNASNNDKAYGYQWWLNQGNTDLRWPSLPAESFAANGNRQQLVMVVPSLDLVIARLGWTAGRYPADARFAEIIDSL